jgi:hypothetical protein
MKITEAFPEPFHTQTPNNFFDMVPDMSNAELRVTLIMIRNTFGWQRDHFEMSVTKLAKAAGLSRQAALDGAMAAQKRGTFKRTNPKSNDEASWSLVTSLQPVDTPLTTRGVPLQPVEETPLKVTSKVGLKKVKDTNKEIKEAPKRTPPPAEVSLFREVTERFPPKVNFQDVVDSVSKMRIRLQRAVTIEDLKPFYAAWCHKGYKPINLSWLEWAETGEIPVNGNWKPKHDVKQERYGGIMEWLGDQNGEQKTSSTDIS